MTDRMLGKPGDQISESEKRRRLEELHKKREAMPTLSDSDMPQEEKDKWMEVFYEIEYELTQLDEKYPDLPPKECPIVVYNIVHTCPGCPSSYTGETEDGKEVYARYRGGYLSVTVDDKTIFGKQLHKDPPWTREELIERRMNGEDWIRKESREKAEKAADSYIMMRKFGGGQWSYDGTMDIEKLVEATKGWFVWSQ